MSCRLLVFPSKHPAKHRTERSVFHPRYMPGPTIALPLECAGIEHSPSLVASAPVWMFAIAREGWPSDSCGLGIAQAMLLCTTVLVSWQAAGLVRV